VIPVDKKYVALGERLKWIKEGRGKAMNKCNPQLHGQCKEVQEMPLI